MISIRLFGAAACALLLACGPAGYAGTYYGKLLNAGPCDDGTNFYDDGETTFVVTEATASLYVDYLGTCDGLVADVVGQTSILRPLNCPAFQRAGWLWAYSFGAGNFTLLSTRGYGVTGLGVDLDGQVIYTPAVGAPRTCTVRWRGSLTLQN